MMKETRGISFYDEEKARTAVGFSEQANRTGAAMKNIADSLGTSVGAELAPVLERLNDFLYSNHDNIQKTIDKIAAGVGTVVKSVEHIVG